MSWRGAEGESKRKREWERKGQRQTGTWKEIQTLRKSHRETQTQRDKTPAE